MEAWSEEEREFWTLRQAIEDSRSFTQFLREIENRTTKVAITEPVMRAVMEFVTSRDKLIVDGFINGTFGSRTIAQHQSALKTRNVKLASLSFCVDYGKITPDKLQKSCRSLRKMAVNWGTRVVIPAIDRLEAINDLDEEMLKLGINVLKEEYRRVDAAVENLRELDQKMHHMLRVSGEVVSLTATNSGEREKTQHWR